MNRRGGIAGKALAILRSIGRTISVARLRGAAFALALLALLCAPLPSRAGDPNDSAIRAVIDSFRTAIIERDKPRFLSLFVSDDIPWQGVLTDDGLAQSKRRDPKASKVAYDRKSTPVAFIDGILRNKARSEETISNIKIDTDGDVATASFDYSFLSGQRIVNWGKECWLLVRTGAGWKITTLAFSSNLTAEEGKR
jgi:hypothetical protein